MSTRERLQRNARQKITTPKIKVVIRPWAPRRIPTDFQEELIYQTLDLIYPKLQTYVYAGWIRRTILNQRGLHFLIATGATLVEARKNFKSSERFGEVIWKV